MTSRTITIGQLADVSGPIPGLFEGAKDGLAAWAAYTNSRGGIGGRKVVVDFIDSALNCNTYENGLKSQLGATFANVGSIAGLDACGEPVLKANPTYPYLASVLIDPKLEKLSNAFTPIGTPPGWTTTTYQWMKDKYGVSAVEHSAALIGMGAAQQYAQQSHAAETIGYRFVYSRNLGAGDTNFVSDILRMKASGVQIVDLTDTSTSIIAAFLKQAAQQSFEPDAVLGGTAYSSQFLQLLGVPSLAHNLVIPLGSALFLGQDATSVPEVATMNTWLSKTHASSQRDGFDVIGWDAGLLFQQAMSNVGGSPTRAKLLAAVQKLTSFTADGLLPKDNNPGQKKAPICVVIGGVVNGTFARIYPKSGFDCKGSFVSYP